MFSEQFNQLIHACTIGDLKTVKALIPTMDVALLQSAALRTAACYNHTPIVLELLPHSDSTAVENDALRHAIEHNNCVLIDALLPLCDPYAKNHRVSVFAWSAYLSRTDVVMKIERLHASSPHDCEGAIEFCVYQKFVPNNTILAHLLSKCRLQNLSEIFDICLNEGHESWIDRLRPLLPDKEIDLACYYAKHNHYPKAEQIWDTINPDTISIEHYKHLLANCLIRLYTPLLQKMFAVRTLLFKALTSEHLSWAVVHGDKDLVEYFLNGGCEINEATIDLACAINPDIALLIMQRGHEQIGINAIENLAGNGWINALKYALENIDVDVFLDEMHRLHLSFNKTIRFEQCGEHNHLQALDMVLDYTKKQKCMENFCDQEKNHRAPEWLNNFVLHFANNIEVLNTVAPYAQPSDMEDYARLNANKGKLDGVEYWLNKMKAPNKGNCAKKIFETAAKNNQTKLCTVVVNYIEVGAHFADKCVQDVYDKIVSEQQRHMLINNIPLGGENKLRRI